MTHSDRRVEFLSLLVHMKQASKRPSQQSAQQPAKRKKVVIPDLDVGEDGWMLERFPAPPKANFDTLPHDILANINRMRVEALVQRRLEVEDERYAREKGNVLLGDWVDAAHRRRREEVQRSFPVSIHAGNPNSLLFRGNDPEDLRLTDNPKLMSSSLRERGGENRFKWGTWTDKQRVRADKSGATFYETVPRALGPGY